MGTLKRYLLIACGLLAVAVGSIGIILPVLPTTPFYLLAAYCFIRSSKKLYNWLINHRIFGKYIYNYIQHRSVKLGAKILALATLWPSLLVSMYIVNRLWITVMLFVIGIAVTIHILSLKTYREPSN